LNRSNGSNTSSIQNSLLSVSIENLFKKKFILPRRLSPLPILTSYCFLFLVVISLSAFELGRIFDLLVQWTSRWTESTKWKPSSEMGKWKHTAGEWYGDASDKGIQTSIDARFYGISAKLDKPYVSSPDKDLVIQYSVKLEQKLDCGGAYIKLLPGGKKFDAASFGGDAPYSIMFGPDVCGTSNKKTHVILHYDKKDENLLIKKEIMCETDNITHLYTLVIHPDNTFEVFIDQKSVRKGKLEDEFDFMPPKEIKDPSASKPEDWVDSPNMPDPEDKKPDGYDDIPKDIPDPDAKKPADWDDVDDGDWEPPTIPNPEYKGPWKQKMIPNPDYKGKWEHPMIPNPDYAPDDKLYSVCSAGCTHVGFELWQVKTGTLFDDIIVTDSLEEAKKFAEETFFKKKDGEKAMYDKVQEEEKKKSPPDMGDMDDMDMGDMDMGMDGMYDEF
jgi:calreticulin